MNLKELIKYKKTLFTGYNNETGSRGYIVTVTTNDEKKYGLSYVNILSNFNQLPDIRINDIVPIKYESINTFENNNEVNIDKDGLHNLISLYPIKLKTDDQYIELKVLINDKNDFDIVDIIKKKDRFRDIISLDDHKFYFIGCTDDDKYSLFKINTIKDKYNNVVPKLRYILKDCEHCNFFNQILMKKSENNILMLNYTKGELIKQKYRGKLISENSKFIILKDNESYLFFEKGIMRFVAVYTNNKIIDVQLCPYDDEFYPLHFDIVILTTKENKKKLLPITISDEYFTFLPTTKEFDDINYKCFSFDEDGKISHSFDGIINNENYRINVELNGNIEILKCYNEEKNNHVLKKTKNNKNLPF